MKDNHDLDGVIPVQELLQLTRLNRLSLVHCSFVNAEQTVEVLRLRLPRCKVWI